MVGFFCKIQRWKLMIKTYNPDVSWYKCAGPFFSSLALNNLLPFRAGDLARIILFNNI